MEVRDVRDVRVISVSGRCAACLISGVREMQVEVEGW